MPTRNGKILKYIPGANEKTRAWECFDKRFLLARQLVQADLVKNIKDWKGESLNSLKRKLDAWQKEPDRQFEEENKKDSALGLTVQMLQKARIKDRKIFLMGCTIKMLPIGLWKWSFKFWTNTDFKFPIPA